MTKGCDRDVLIILGLNCTRTYFSLRSKIKYSFFLETIGNFERNRLRSGCCSNSRKSSTMKYSGESFANRDLKRSCALITGMPARRFHSKSHWSGHDEPESRPAYSSGTP